MPRLTPGPIRSIFALYRKLAPQHQPRTSLTGSIAELCDGLAAIGFADPDFRRSQLIRLHVLDAMIRDGALSAALLRRPEMGTGPS